MVERLEDPDLGLEALPVLDLGPGDCLDSSPLSIFAMRAPTDFAIGALAERLFLAPVNLVDTALILDNEGLLADDEVFFDHGSLLLRL